MNMDVVSSLFEPLFSSFEFLGPSLWYWLPPVLLFFFWTEFRSYTLKKYIAHIEWITLEVRLPREISKSPLAMELALSCFHQTSDKTWYERIFKGYVRPWFSLELVSIGGAIRFLFHIPSFYRSIVESNVYAQYPEAEIAEVPDYTHQVPINAGQKSSGWESWGIEFQLTKADPYPIKTYVDYGLDKDPKEEFKNDPIGTLIEVLGSLSPEEHLWIQILVQGTRKRFPKPYKSKGVFSDILRTFRQKEQQDWQAEGEALLAKIVKRDESPKEGVFKFNTLTSAEENVAKAIARSIEKLGFDCGIRAFYLAPKEKFQSARKVALLAAFKQFSSQHLNGFKPRTSTSPFDYPWQDPFGWREATLRARMLTAYRRRGYFYHPYTRPPFVLNSEELATIYHFPGSAVETPTFSRIESRRSEPPANLPL